jgi:hypothetical protein
MNKVLFRAIQKSLVADIRGVYNTFSEEYDNLQGLILQLNINMLYCFSKQLLEYINVRQWNIGTLW